MFCTEVSYYVELTKGEVMGLFGDIYNAVIPIAQGLADNFVAGENLNKDQKQGLYIAYVAAKVYGDDIVESTENEYDDVGLEALADFCADTLEEAGIIVPVIPDELLEAPPADEQPE